MRNARNICYTLDNMNKTSERNHTFKVAIIANRRWKAARDRISGIIRRLSERKDVQIIDTPTWQFKRTMRIHVDGAMLSDNSSQFLPRRTKVVTFECATLRSTRGKCNHDVYLSNSAVAQAAADLLIRRGHRHFAFIGSNVDEERYRSPLRARCFAQYLSSKGYGCAIFSPPKQETADELHRLADFLTALPKPCGVMLYADNLAQSVLDACRYAHLTCPEQIALVGVDNEIDICENIHPTLSSVLPDFEGAGYLGADLLLKLLDGEEPEDPSPTYGVKAVIERDSTQDLRGGGQLVMRVDNYLRENFTQKITIDDIAKRLHVSRRLVEMRFREIRECSVLDRLTALRMAEAKHKLETTTIPVGEIATACGYGTVQAFRNAFIAATHMSPREYRKNTGLER